MARGLFFGTPCHQPFYILLIHRKLQKLRWRGVLHDEDRGGKRRHRILTDDSGNTESWRVKAASQDPVKDILGKIEQAGELGFAGAEKAGSASGEQQEGFPVQRPDRICPVIIPA